MNQLQSRTSKVGSPAQARRLPSRTVAPAELADLQALAGTSSLVGNLSTLQRLADLHVSAVASQGDSQSLQGTSVPGLSPTRISRPATAGPVAQRALDDNARAIVDERLIANNLDNYNTLSARFSSTKIAEIEQIWNSMGKGKKRNRKVVAANSIVKKVQTYLAAFATAAGKWNQATFATAAASLAYHFAQHPGPWEDVQEYTDAAITFKTAQAANMYVLSADRKKVVAAGLFLITNDAGELITFGQDGV